MELDPLESEVSQAPQPGTNRPPRRRRTRLACEACKLRKRKCDGQDPCESCVRYEYRCCYEYHPRKKVARHSVSSSAPAAKPTSPSQMLSGSPTSLDVVHAISPDRNQTKVNSAVANGEKSMEANSGVVFPHVLGLKLNPSSAPKVQGFGWNLGIRRTPGHSEKSIVWILSRDEWQRLYSVYIDRIHPMYGFLDLHAVSFKAARRWEDPSATNHYDSVLCGIAALGSLFSSSSMSQKASEQERHLVECAKEILETTSTMNNPSLHDAEAWLLRTLYLRCNSPPHAAWMASSTTMHIIEATGIHQESSGVSLVYSDTAAAEQNIECQRRLFWLAELLNTWISFEYGRSRVVLQGISCQYPTPKVEGDPTTDLLSLFRISENLDPDRIVQAGDLEESLLQIENFDFEFDALVLSQSNLSFTFYRRLRLLSPNLHNTVIDRLIRLGRKGLRASSRCVDTGSPWWHVANVPFQFTCILLAIDTHESLTHVRDSIATLKKAANYFDTQMPRKASETVERLIQLSQKRKEQDASLLGECIEPQDRNEATTWRQQTDLSGQGKLAMNGAEENFMLWSNDLLGYPPDLNAIDWDVFARQPLDLSVGAVPTQP